MATPDPKSQTLVSQIIVKIRERIVTEGMKEGDRFATEEELAKAHGVSRGIAREAIIHLRAQGILESRQGKGLLVTRTDPLQQLANSLPFFANSDKNLVSIARLRYVLEVGAIELAVLNATEEQTKQLTELANQIEQLCSEGSKLKDVHNLDMAFHSLMLEMTGDPLISGMHGVLSDYFEVVVSRLGSNSEYHESSRHDFIADAICCRDVELARSLLRRHLGGLLSPTQPGLHEAKVNLPMKVNPQIDQCLIVLVPER
jgi:DNA-binding FadR family transcriptional regulator